MDSSYIPSGELAWLSFIWVWKDELAHSIFNSSFDCLQHVRLDTKRELNDPQETSIRRRLYFNYRLLKFGGFFPSPPSPLALPSAHFRCSTSNQQRDRNHSAAGPGGNTPFCNASLTTEEWVLHTHRRIRKYIFIIILFSLTGSCFEDIFLSEILSFKRSS